MLVSFNPAVSYRRNNVDNKRTFKGLTIDMSELCRSINYAEIIRIKAHDVAFRTAENKQAITEALAKARDMEVQDILTDALKLWDDAVKK